MILEKKNIFIKGSYLNQKVKTLFTKCDICQFPRYHHVSLYYFNEKCIKICAELSGVSKSLAKMHERDSSYFYIDDSIDSKTDLLANKIKKSLDEDKLSKIH